MISAETKKKAKKLIKKVEENENLEQKKEPCIYVQQIKAFQNKSAYIGVPRKNIMTPFKFKIGDWVKIKLEKMDMSE